MNQLYRSLEQHLEVFKTNTPRFLTRIGQSYIIFLSTVSCRNSKLRPNFSTPDFRIVDTHICVCVCVCMCFAILKFAQKSTTSDCHSQQLLWPVKCTQKRKISSNTTHRRKPRRSASSYIPNQWTTHTLTGVGPSRSTNQYGREGCSGVKLEKKQYIFCFPS